MYVQTFGLAALPISSVEETGWCMAEWLLQLKGYTTHAAGILIDDLGGLNPCDPPPLIYAP